MSLHQAVILTIQVFYQIQYTRTNVVALLCDSATIACGLLR